MSYSINTSFLSITYTVWVIVSFKNIYKMNIFHGEGIDNCFLNALTRCSLTLPEILHHIYSITVLTKGTLPSDLRTFITFKRWELTLILLFPMEIIYINPNNLEFARFLYSQIISITLWVWSLSWWFGLVIIICLRLKWRCQRPIQDSYQ